MSETPTGAPLRERVAEEVRVLLARKRLSATQLAKRMGVSQAYMWRRLSGETAFDLDDLERIGALLGVEPAELLPRPANLSRSTNLDKTHAPVRPRDNRPKGRSENGLANRRTRQKRALTPEELSVIAA